MKYTLLNGEKELEMATVVKRNTISSHTYIQQRDPKYLNVALNSEKETWVSLPLYELDINDLEQLRTHMLNTEADVETNIVVMYQDDQTKQQDIDLTRIPGFFLSQLGEIVGFELGYSLIDVYFVLHRGEVKISFEELEQMPLYAIDRLLLLLNSATKKEKSELDKAKQEAEANAGKK